MHRLQDFPITAELLRNRNYIKVLRCIIKDPTLKYPESFKLHDRCQEVLDVWKEPIEQLKLEKQLEYEDNKLNPSHHSHGHGHGLDAANRKAIHNQDDSEVSGLEQSIPELEAQGKTGRIETCKYHCNHYYNYNHNWTSITSSRKLTLIKTHRINWVGVVLFHVILGPPPSHTHANSKIITLTNG